MAAAARPLAGVEVPVPGSDRVRWVEVTVPSSTSSSPLPSDPLPPRNAAGCHVIVGDPQGYFIWRIHLNLPNVLEVTALFACKEFPETGLRLIFKEALCPFAFLCKNEVWSRPENRFLLYVITVSGVGYLCNLKSPFPYVSGSIFPQSELVEVNFEAHAPHGKITAVAATPGCLITGRQDGSIFCYQLGKLDPNAPGFSNELRDDGGIGRLWNLVSRQKVIGPVQDMAVSQVCGRQWLFALHMDGNLRVWDLVNHARVLCHNITSRELQGTYPSKLWVGEANDDKQLISLAVLHQDALAPEIYIVAVCHFGFSSGDRNIFSPDPLMQYIRLEEGRLVDLKISSNKLWILKEDGQMLYDLSYSDRNLERSSTYVLQEDFVAEQLFQSSEHALDDLIWTNSAIFSSTKDQNAYFISSIFLRRLLQPGVHHCAALCETVLEHKKYLSDNEFQSLTVAGLKKEIFTIIESMGAAMGSSATAYYWKNFCSCFFRHWCQSNTPYGLLFDSRNDVLGLIRKSSFSLFRSLEGVEQLIYGFSDDNHKLNWTGVNLSDNDIDCEILFEVLRCMSHINHQLGRAAAAIYYESLISPVISSDDIIFQLLKTLETGYNPTLATSLTTQLGMDASMVKKQLVHKSQRKFAVDMLLSLRSLRARSSNWGGVLDVIEKYMMFLVPKNNGQKITSEAFCNVNSSILVQASSQVARAMFESAFDVLLLLGYLVNISGQVSIMQTDVVRIKQKLIPAIQDILAQWLFLHFLGTTPTMPPTIEDFSSRLSSLHIGNKDGNLLLDEKLGSSDFTLASLLNFPSSDEGQDFLCLSSLLNPIRLNHLVWNFITLILWGKTDEEESPVFSCLPSWVVLVLLRHGQYEAAENLFGIVDTYSSSKKVYQSPQSSDSEWCSRLHLQGFCLLVRAHTELNGVLKEQKSREAIRCFFRAASGQGAPHSLHIFSSETGFQYSGENVSAAVWKLHYYQWVMQTFEQYGMGEGACQFALAALEQVDVIAGLDDDEHPEPSSTTRGRLWANVFKFTLDLKHYQDAYCAIISNPDEDSKYVCLRRFVIVLCELGATKVLCDGEIPFVGLVEKVEQELFWKAERSDVSSKPNLYKVLYAFEAYKNNWKKAASYMYRYCLRLKNEVNLEGNRQISAVLQERLHALSIVINALQLVDRAYAWIDSPCKYDGQGSPYKRTRNVLAENSAYEVSSNSCGLQFCIDVDVLEKEYVLTSAQYLLAIVNDKFKISGSQALPNLVDVLIQENFYDMAFTIILNFWKGSALKRELERAFVNISQECCPNRVRPSGAHVNASNLLLLSSEDDAAKGKDSPAVHQFKGNSQWEKLELYLEKYRKMHPRLPVTVAETLLYTDPQFELPLWLVQMFKGGRRATSWGMTGQESDPATLFRLYIDYGRHAEATNLLLEYLESFASLRPADVINRKKMSSVWFPYAAIERLWCQLEKMQSSGHMVDQCDKLKQLLRGALMSYLKQVEVDSEDVLSSIPEHEMQRSNS